MGFFLLFFLGKMICKVCHRSLEDKYHPYCRAHSYCAVNNGAQYYADPCIICHELFDRASEVAEDPEDALEAYQALLAWITGFRKNSKRREKGQDHFYSPVEREAFQRVHSLHSGHAPGRPAPPPPSMVSKVSWFVCIHLNFMLYH